MIDITNKDLYEASLKELQKYGNSVGRNFKGRLTQVFLALKFWRSEIPSIFSDQSVSALIIQKNIDDLYSKESRPSNNCVLRLFDNNYLAKTGVVGLGNTSPQNTWRNNFRLQKGIVCYASSKDLADHDFLNQNRLNCRYLQPVQQGSLKNATCILCQSEAKYRGEEQPKWLRAETTVRGESYSLVDMANIQNFLPHIAPNGQRIPILPLIVALYHDPLPGIYVSRKEVDINDFASDYGFSQEELIAYFEDKKQNQYNLQLLRNFPSVDYTPISQSLLKAVVSVPAISKLSSDRQIKEIPNPILSEVEIPEPGSNSGWGAQQYVMEVLRNNDWIVYDVSQQRCGYDLLAEKGNKRKYIEVKSSLGSCSPTLTEREWQKAKEYGSDYWLAIIENFRVESQNQIYWIHNPTENCNAREITVIQYSINRSSWLVAVNDDLDIEKL